MELHITHIEGLMHEWVDQFVTQPKFLFTQIFGEIMEITTSLYLFYIVLFHIFSMSLMAHFKFLFL